MPTLSVFALGQLNVLRILLVNELVAENVREDARVELHRLCLVSSSSVKPATTTLLIVATRG